MDNSQGPVPHISYEYREEIAKKLGVEKNDPELTNMIDHANRLSDLANAHVALNAMGAGTVALGAAKRDFEAAAEQLLEQLVPFVMTQLMKVMTKEIYTPGLVERKAAEAVKRERRKASKKAAIDAWRKSYKD